MHHLAVLVISAVLSGLPQGSSLHSKDHYIKVKSHILGQSAAEKPLVLIWNVNSSSCSKFGVDLLNILDEFEFVYNKGHTVEKSDEILLLYEKDFEYFPHFDRTSGLPINGGLPQNGNLTALLEEFNGVIKNLPTDFDGLGVIDWESWRPLYDRMNGTIFTIYREESLKLVRRKFPNWTRDQQLEYAKFEYQLATRRYMESVLKVGKISRPRGLWGFYLFPDCRYYNYSAKDYSCSELEQRRNDEIQWLFDSSTALFPSVYINKNVQDEPYAAQYVANRIREALRIDSNRPGNVSAPVFSYHIVNYPREDEFMDLYDLRNSIGVAALLGGSGVVIWGSGRNSASPDRCEELKDYLKTTLGPFCKAVTETALKCSLKYCHGHGRCVVVKYDRNMGERYLTPEEGVRMVEDFVSNTCQLYESLLSVESVTELDQPYIKCQCYIGWQGQHCQMPS